MKVQSQHVLLAPAILSVLTLAVCTIPASAYLRLAGEQELAAATGGACLGAKADRDFCAGDPVCVGGFPDGKFRSRTATNAIKNWCDPNGVSKVCDCNQNGVPQSSCGLEKVCEVENCTDCYAANPITTVQTTVNLNGKPCKADAQCDSL
jgi:hypothetical protein